MFITYPGTRKIMSVLIAICDRNIALLAADSRMSINSTEQSSEYYFDDSCHKVFKLNDRLMFGGAGVYERQEDLCAAFKGYELSALTLEHADKLIQGYMSKLMQRKTDLRNRCYILCGRNIDNEMCIYTYEYDVMLREEEVHYWNMSHEDVCKLHVGLSPILTKRTDEYAEKLRAIMHREDTIQGLKNGISELIREIADVDWTVGGEPEIIMI